VREFTRKRLAITGFLPLPISHEHGMTAGELPLHHRDPFDRILIAQAQTEGLVLITGEENEVIG
jgi:PIN domain nuclease of toxin-antitoxin system